MESGPSDDSNRIYLIVNIIDNFNGVTVFDISNPIQVVSDNQLENSLLNQISSNDKSSDLLQKINEGSIKKSNCISAVASILNRKKQELTDPNVIFLFNFCNWIVFINIFYLSKYLIDGHRFLFFDEKQKSSDKLVIKNVYIIYTINNLSVKKHL